MLRLLTSAIAAALLLGTGAVHASEEISFFRIATGGVGGTYYPVGGLIAQAISNPPGSRPCDKGGSCGVPALVAVAQSAHGSVANIEAIAADHVDSGFAQSDIAYWAYTGTGLYENIEPISDLRSISHLYAELVHVVVPGDSEANSVADLRGRRVSLGKEGSGTLIDARIVMAAFGLADEDVEAAYLSPEPSSDMMLNGELDAFFIVGGAPFLAVEDLARRIPIRLLPLDGPETEQLLSEQPFFSSTVLQEGTYPGVEETATIAVGADWLASASLDEELVYGLTRALWHPTTRILLDSGHARGAEIRLEHALRGLAVPLHPGAARYYREIGLLPLDAPAPN